MERLLKLVIPTIFFLVGALILYIVGLNTFITILAIFSGILQLAMFLYWIIVDSKQEVILEKTEETLHETKETKSIANEIKEYQAKKEGDFEKKQRILTNLINKGAIPTQQINKVIKSMRKRGMFIISTLGGKEFKLKKVLDLMGEEQSISLVPEVLSKLRFKKVYFNDSIFIILKEDLPKKLRNAEKLKNIIYNELSNKWKLLQKFIIDNNLRVHEKWITGSGFGCNLCIIDIEEGEIGVLYKRLSGSDERKDCFSDEFKSLLLGHADSRKVGEFIKDKIKAQKVLDKLGIGILFENLPQKTKEKLLKNEIKIMGKLKIDKFLDISNISPGNLKEAIKTYVKKAEIDEISEEILSLSKEYIKVIRELGILSPQ